MFSIILVLSVLRCSAENFTSKVSTAPEEVALNSTAFATSAASTNGTTGDVEDVEYRQKLLDAHNYYRAEVASGRVKGQPAAADMLLLDYDLLVEQKAASWNKRCLTGHDRPQQRLMANYSFAHVGQNRARLISDALVKAAEVWWLEKDNYTFGKVPGKVTKPLVGHYTQMMWASTAIIGCSIKPNCPAAGETYVTCNYAPSGNLQGAKPYKVGKACSSCPDGYSYCMGGALCARADQCAKQESDCKCAFQKCENGGKFKPETCLCSCPDGFIGDRCQTSCEETSKYCKYPYTVNCSKSFFKNKCRIQCQGCEIKNTTKGNYDIVKYTINVNPMEN